MYATGTRAVESARKTHNLADRKHCPHRRRSQKAGCGAKKVRNAFLKQRNHPIAPVSVVRNEHTKEYNYITRENYEYLLASVRRYAELLGRELGHDPGLTPGEGIANLYRELEAMVGDEVNINIETDGLQLRFVLWRFCDWGTYNFYWIPVGFVEKLNTRLRRIAISFLHRFMKSNGLETTNSSFVFENIGMWYDERSGDPAENEPEELARLAAMYSDDGEVGKLMREIEKNCYHKRLDLALDRYYPQSEYEASLVALMKRGLKFISSDTPSIISCAYDPFRDEKELDFCGVMPESVIMLTYDVHCEFEREVRQFVQEDINQNYEVMAASTLILRPDGDSIFTVDSYPAEIYGYMDDLLEFLTGGAEWTRIY